MILSVALFFVEKQFGNMKNMYITTSILFIINVFQHIQWATIHYTSIIDDTTETIII